MILFSSAAADPNRPDDLTIPIKRDAASKGHDPTTVRYLDAEELVARLTVLSQLRGRDVERSRGPRLVVCDLDAADPGPVHAYEGDGVAAKVGDGNTHRLADPFGLVDSRFDNPLRFC